MLQFDSIWFTSTPDFDRRYHLITIPGQRISQSVKHMLIFEVVDWNKNFTSHMITGWIDIFLSSTIRDIYSVSFEKITDSFITELLVNESFVRVKHEVCFQALQAYHPFLYQGVIRDMSLNISSNPVTSESISD